ncbi:MAG TPA: isoprenyl transferase [Vicinamibacteria bacterium]|nr:isoprenyl transferase [Vicinamibacteria bacterium]
MSLQDLLDVVPSGSEEQALLRSIDFSRLPRHVAIIMDGNGRWAKLRRKRRVEGHRAGIAAVRDTVEASARLGLQVLTLYAFSVENWKRPKSEVSTLMGLLKHYLRSELGTLLRNNIRFRVIGRPEDLPRDVQGELQRGTDRTAANTGLLFNIALNYGGRAEITDAVRRLLMDILANGRDPQRIDEQALSSYLYTAGQPDPDLLIRTSGELRISNFLLWQIAYSEIWVTDVLWPDFRREHLFEAIREFQRRDRRFGGVEA